MIYTHPSENIANSVTPSLTTGTADSNYPLANLTNGDPARPFITSDTAGIRVVWDFSSPTRVDYVSLPMHGIPAGTNVRFQMNALNSWSSPSVNMVLTMAYEGDMPTVAIADVTTSGNYLVGGYQFSSLFVASHGGTTKIGDFEIWSQKRTFSKNLRFGTTSPHQRIVTVHRRVDGGRLVYDHQLLDRRIGGTVRFDATDFAKLKALQVNSKGAFRPFLVQASDIAEHLYVWWPSPFAPSRLEAAAATRDTSVEWQEVGRGMPL